MITTTHLLGTAHKNCASGVEVLVGTADKSCASVVGLESEVRRAICLVGLESEVVGSEAKHDIVGSEGKNGMCRSAVKHIGADGKHDIGRSEAKHDIVGSEGKHDPLTDCIPEHVRLE